MSDDQSISELKDEITELRRTVMMLQETVQQLTLKLDPGISDGTTNVETGQYQIFPRHGSLIERDTSWERLVGLLKKADQGLTARELAGRWGKSRSRTSEVLNRLVEEGEIVKYRDGRRIRFKTP